MSSINKIVRLDYISIKPYLTLKNLIILLGISTFYVLMGNNSSLIFGIATIFAILYSTYPFLVGEQSGIDYLYKVFGISNKDIVFGRYLTSILINVIAIVAGLVINFVFSFFTKKGFTLELLILIPMMFAFCQLVINAQYPFYFKLGYAKGRNVIRIVFLFVGVIVFLFKYFQNTIMEMLKSMNISPVIAILVIVAVFGVIQVVSIMLSMKWYSERE